jgi:hypothetical protein
MGGKADDGSYVDCATATVLGNDLTCICAAIP